METLLEQIMQNMMKKKKTFLSKGPTKIITSQNYDLEGSNIFLDNAEKFIKSDDKATIVDQEGNIINLDNFEYQLKVIFLNQ